MLRALCPFHGSDHQRSLRVHVRSGRFVCFACGAWGYLAEARERWRRSSSARRRSGGLQPAAPRHQPPASSPAPGRQRGLHQRRPPPRTPAPAPPDLAQQLAAFQAALPGSRGDSYLHQRGIPLALAQQLRRGLCGAGHLAACGPRLARRPRGLSAYHAGRAPGEPLWACGGDCRAGAQGEAP